MARRRRPPRPGALSELAPLKILMQILLLQMIYYISGTFLILFTALVAGKGFSMDMVLSWRTLRGDTTVGWMLGLVWLLNALVSVVAILLLISRSKLVPDFALTIHFLHLLTVSVYTGSLPQNLLWWLLQIASSAVMISLGMWTCQYRELRPIMFGGTATAAPATVSTITPGEAVVEHHGDEEQGFGRGSRRGRGRDGAGEYEMVGLKGKSSEAVS